MVFLRTMDWTWEESEKQMWRKGRWAEQDVVGVGGRCNAFSVDILLRMHFMEQGRAQWVSVGHISEQMNEQAHYFR